MTGKPIYAALQSIQRDLKATKDKVNDFGKYKYRSAESIIEAVKPLLNDNGLILLMSDEVVEVGDRIYVKAEAKLVDVVNADEVKVTAYAREADSKRGMDESQVTGSTSSYARKYALNGLFAIDDGKDADTNEFHEEKKSRAKAEDEAKAKEDVVKKQAINRLNKIMKDNVLSKNFVRATSKNICGKETTTVMTADEVVRVAEELERLVQEAEL
ncbi:ERF superfamily protein [Anaerovibrio lipolyticus DSM 3074]|uniref:ERF superfamily protein n=1 Tax=Anaerovibrio lipolyticus DSM 3074 TaxID=1120997 RepID=A0A1M6C4T1_9FIRM|nr:ERF family protein [Anaerovibrio lipolyticus]SHI56036.1 ERF superfamily protein [Anaerovibrio lipolyticus DSM 3074]